MTPFTATWFAFLVALVVFAVAAHRALRHRPDVVRRRWLLALAVGNWAMSTWFTFDRILDPAIDFPLTQNLPFHFCTIATFLLVPAVWFRRGWWVRPLHALLFFPGAVAGFAALASPGDGYAGMPLLHMNTLFYVVHGLNWVIPVLIVSLGYYRPTVRDAVASMGYFVVLALAVLPITLAERAWIDPGANYFYMFDPEGAGVLVLLWDLIGVPLVYELPLLVAVLPVLLLQVALHRGISAIARRRARFAPALEPIPGSLRW